MGTLEKIYRNLPSGMRNFAASSFGLYWYWLRLGGNFSRHCEDFRSREFLTRAGWSDYQKKKVSQILHKAVYSVPYYIQTWNKEDKMNALAGRLDKLPLLEKEPIRLNPESFLDSKLRPIKRHSFHTSGSTGTPIRSIWTTNEVRKATALRETRSNSWAGVSYKMPRATFSGRIVVPKNIGHGPFYVYNHAEKQVYFSAFHLSLRTAKDYIVAIKKFKIKWLTGYAVSFYLLAKFILELNLRVPKLNALITTSEKLTLKMKKTMEEAFQCRVFEEYSTVETAIFASECENKKLHLNPDVSIVEIIRTDGKPCEPGEVGEIVTTPLIHDFQLLIRYRLGDLGCWDTVECECGRMMPVVKEILGRVEDVVKGPDGRKMVRFHGIFSDQPNVREGQIIQEKIDYIIVKVVPTKKFGVNDVREIRKRIKDRLGAVEVDVVRVEGIERTSAGKFKAVISNLDKDKYYDIEPTMHD